MSRKELARLLETGTVTVKRAVAHKDTIYLSVVLQIELEGKVAIVTASLYPTS